MSSVIVADTSCLIGLDKIGKLNLLPLLYSDIVIPPAVAEEFGQPVPFVRIESPLNDALVLGLHRSVGAGESEAIALALECDYAIILDDKRARKIAVKMGLAPIGTVGVLVEAKRAGYIRSLSEALDDLGRMNFYISPKLRQDALMRVGEA